jgi:integrase/recombinase XerD
LARGVFAEFPACGIANVGQCEEFLQEVSSNNRRESTLYKYKILFKQLRGFSERNGYRFLSELTTSALRKFRSEWKNNSLSGSKKLQLLRSFFNFAEEWITQNPARKLRPPTVEYPEAVPFTHEQIKAILDACQTFAAQANKSSHLNVIRMRSLVLLLRYTGLRIGDAVGLSTNRLSGTRLFVTTAKTRTKIYVPLPAFVVWELEATPRASMDYYFWTSQGKLHTAVKVWETCLKRLFTLAGIPDGHSHQFRHTFATSLLRDGVPIERVSALLGHKTVQVTERHYRHWVLERQQQAEADVARVWQHDPLVLLESSQPNPGTPDVHGKRSVVN